MKNENGRSMIEMLGVLAIIGVLSIGGLAGYTMAMNRHRANAIIDYASKCAVIAQTQGDGSAEIAANTDCIGAAYMNAAVPATAQSITVERAANGNTTVTVVVDSEAVSTAMASRLGINKTANNTYHFSPERTANGGWAS